MRPIRTFFPFDTHGRSFAREMVRFAIVAITCFIFLRLYQYFLIKEFYTVPEDFFRLELRGFLDDILFGSSVLAISSIPAFFLYRWKVWAGKALIVAALLLVFLMELSLFQYFIITLVPLDQVIFSYSISEMALIVRNSVPVTWSTFIPSGVAVILFSFLMLLVRRMRFTGAADYFIVVLIILSPVIWLLSIPQDKNYRNSYNYNLVINKSGYLLINAADYFRRPSEPGREAIKMAARRYHSAHPDQNFLGWQYPFLKQTPHNDVLSPYFDLKPEKPNLVFVVVESLSMCFIGNNNLFGSFTPFLDSLCRHSLVWSNFLSTSDRTFNVLPALFASLPPGSPSIMDDIPGLPWHCSLIRILKRNGYASTFFYGGDPNFNNMADFLRKQEIGRIVHPQGWARVSGWGISDGELFQSSFEQLNTEANAPRLDIYLTLSLHAPFNPPGKDQLLAEVDRRRNSMNPKPSFYQDSELFKDIFAAILYTDQALKKFIDQYRRREDFNNTIFIITGDHALPELNLHRVSALMRYNVPLIIYSPLLKDSRFMRATSSHLDVSPSILAMLKNRYGFPVNEVTHWLGDGLDTAQNPRSLKTLAFIQNNKVISEYLSENYFIMNGKVSEVLPEFWLKDKPDPELKAGMQQQLDDFKLLNAYVTRNNRLMPPEVFFGKLIDSMSVMLTDSLSLDASDSIGEYRVLCLRQEIPAKVRYLDLNLSVDMDTRETDTAKAPLLVFDLFDQDGNRLHWQSLRFRCIKSNGGKETHRWKTMESFGRIRFDHLDADQRKILKLYVWNYHHCNVRLFNSDLRIKGFF